METDIRVSPLSLLFEARHELRTHLVLETALIGRINEFPEDDFCHNARESMSLGAGYAYTQLHRDSSEDQWFHVFSTFFAMQPRNKYSDEAGEREVGGKVIKAALDWLDRKEPPEIDPNINQYTVEELVAFIEGFMMTREYFESQGYTSPSPVAELA